ncbi:hypothetical protein VTG60DRAFT_1007 [Thermothelomyces hinnuleus]
MVYHHLNCPTHRTFDPRSAAWTKDLPRSLEFPVVQLYSNRKAPRAKGPIRCCCEAPLAPRMSPVELLAAVSRRRAIACLCNLDEISRASRNAPSPDRTSGSPPSASYPADVHSKSRPQAAGARTHIFVHEVSDPGIGLLQTRDGEVGRLWSDGPGGAGQTRNWRPRSAAVLLWRRVSATSFR